MPVFRLGKNISFPPVKYSEPEGIIAVGGDLSPERLIEAYSNGIFPWYSEKSPIMWWSPDPRFVIFPEKIRISKSMRQVLKRKTFRITFDTVFSRVISACSGPRHNDNGTWITPAMIKAYRRLHDMGYAHSVEAWSDNKLAGGLYGISLGRAFFGESMFSKESNASKAAFLTLAVDLGRIGFDLIDCQVYTPHLESLGAEMISRDAFLEIIMNSLEKESIPGSWQNNPLFNSDIY